VQRDLKCRDAAQRIGQRRMYFARHPRVGNHDRVAVQFVAMLLEKSRETFAADFLLGLR